MTAWEDDDAVVVAAIRAHAEAHRASGRATFSVAGVERLLELLDAAELHGKAIGFDEGKAYMKAALRPDPGHLGRVIDGLVTLDNVLGDAPVLNDAIELLRKLR